MLVELSIQNIAIIENINVSFKNQLNVITGETGAGKSLIVQTIQLLKGERAKTEIISKNKQQATVIACFQISDNHPAIKVIKDYDIQCNPNEEIIIRRTLTNTGKNKIYINNVPVNLQILKNVTEKLIEIHTQKDSKILENINQQRQILDQYANIKQEMHKLNEQWHKMNEVSKKKAEIQKQIQEQKQQEQFFLQQISELQQIEPKIGEEEKLIAKRKIIMNAGKIIDTVTEAIENIQNENGAEIIILNAEKAIRKIADQEIFGIKNVAQHLENAQIEISEAVVKLQEIQNQLEFHEQDLQNIDDRLFQLRNIARKYNVTINQLEEVKNQATQKQHKLAQIQLLLQNINEQEKKEIYQYQQIANLVSEKRKFYARKIVVEITNSLQKLKLPNAKFDIKILPKQQYDHNGIDEVSFYISLNRGVDMMPLQKIVSGGEMSRIILAFRAVISRKAQDMPIMLFDEIDTGTGGAVSQAVGSFLAIIAEKTQTIVVTHSPQVAAQAKNHFLITKIQNHKVKTQIQLLDGKNKEQEISRMLAGKNITSEAQAAARKLISEAQTQ